MVKSPHPPIPAERSLLSRLVGRGPRTGFLDDHPAAWSLIPRTADVREQRIVDVAGLEALFVPCLFSIRRRLHCSQHVPYKARGRRRLGSLFPPKVQPPSQKLPGEEGSHQYRKGDELPSQPGKDAKSNYKRNRDVNRKKPLQRELVYVGSPIAKEQI